MEIGCDRRLTGSHWVQERARFGWTYYYVRAIGIPWLFFQVFP